MPPVEIEDLNDQRLEPFRQIRSRNWTQGSGIFIAEGPLVTQRLLDSEYECESILLDSKFAERYLPLLDRGTQLMVMSHNLIEQLVGYNFHRGVLACGKRQARKSLDDFSPPTDEFETTVVLVGIQDLENLGGILRSCAGLGVRRVIMGPTSADPLSRRALRVSMGTALDLDIYHSDNLIEDLKRLQNRFGFEGFAASLTADSIPLQQIERRGAALLVFGNERHGLSGDALEAIKYSVRIDMALDVDSLNVGVAAGIMIHYFCRLANGAA